MGKQKNDSSPLQFWILDVLCFKNQTFMTMGKRFCFFSEIDKAYKCLQKGPISIHALHFEAYLNRKNLLKFISKRENDCVVYANREGNEYEIDGLVAIKDGNPCVIHDRESNDEKCVLLKCKF